MANPVINGKRVILRSPEVSDSAELVALNRASVQFHHHLVSPPRTSEEFDQFLQRSAQTNTECFLICDRKNRNVLGTINLSEIVRGPFQSAYLGYYVGAAYANRGYMTEALQLMLRYTFKELKLHRVEANIQPNNKPSIALVRRAGFTREGYSRRYLKISGRWRDHDRWAITIEDWQNLRSR